MDNSRFLPVAEVMRLLNLTKHQVYRRIARGDLPAVLVRDGNLHYEIPADAVEAYLAAGGNRRDGNNAAMLRVSQVAERLGFTTETVRRMAYSGRLPYVRGSGPRGHMRIPAEAVEEYLNGRPRSA